VSRDWISISGRPTMRQIAAEVADAHGVRPAALYTKVRHRWVVHPRQEAMARMSYAGFSHTQIVRHFGLKDHTTSIHAKQAFEARPPGYRVPPTITTVKAMRAADRALAQQEAA
jgi:hypothetical protein